MILLGLARDGRVVDRVALSALARRLPDATDCFVFCHGWLNDRDEARAAAARFFSLMLGATAPLGDRVRPLRVAVAWPSKPFAVDGRGAPSQAEGVVELLPNMADMASREPGRLQRLLATVADALVPRSPEDEIELDALRRRARQPAAGRGGAGLSLANALSFWMMKQRAGEIGERLGREVLAPLMASADAVRLHLVGHSFGAKLLTSAVFGGLPADSLTLLLGAFSAFAFADEVPNMGRPGYYRRVLVERRVRGPIAVLFSAHDRALTSLYPAVTSAGQSDRSRSQHPGRFGHSRDVVAQSALGALGARGIGAPEIDLIEAQRTGIPQRAVVNVNASSVVRAAEWLIGAHRDIHHPEIANLVVLAAGLLQGGPEGLRPRPRDPLARP
jgi:hypothetical protein